MKFIKNKWSKINKFQAIYYVLAFASRRWAFGVELKPLFHVLSMSTMKAGLHVMYENQCRTSQRTILIGDMVGTGRHNQVVQHNHKHTMQYLRRWMSSLHRVSWPAQLNLSLWKGNQALYLTSPSNESNTTNSKKIINK